MNNDMNLDEYNDNNSTDKFLVYQLAGELFATPLIEVRGVVEYHLAKPIPHTAPYYKGVINIRGEIMGVIDLRERLGLSADQAPACQLIFESDSGALAGNVDRVISVSVLTDENIDRKASVDSTNKERSYFQGIAKLEGKILTLISLSKIANSTELS